MQEPIIKSLYKKEWAHFKTEKFPQLISCIDAYSATIKTSYTKDHAKWPNAPNDLAGDTNRMKDWLNARVAYMDNYTSGW